MFASMFLPRTIGIGLWALSLSILLRQARTTRFDDMSGIAQQMPFSSAGFGIASLTLAGLPLLAVFPIRQALLEALARQSLITALWALAGSVGMLFGTFRALSVLVRGASLTGRGRLPVAAGSLPAADGALSPQAGDLPAAAGDEPLTNGVRPAVFSESRTQIALVLVGIISLLLIGLFPQAFFQPLNGLLAGYPQLP